jgi:hypothetical protein
MLSKLRQNMLVLGVSRRPLLISGAALLAAAIFVVYLRAVTPPAYATNYRNWPLADLPPLSAVVLWLASATLVPLITGILSAYIALRTYFSEAHALLSLETSSLDRVLAFVGLCLYRLQGLLVVVVLALAVTIEYFVVQSTRMRCILAEGYCNSPIGPIQIVSLSAPWCASLFLLAAAIGVHFAFRMKSSRAYRPAGLVSLTAGVLVTGVYYRFFWGRPVQVLPESLGVAATVFIALAVISATRAWAWTRKLPQGVRRSKGVSQARS